MIHSKFIIPLMFLVVNVATAATKIASVNVTPATATAGAIFKFTTTLTAPLIVGDKVKINVGSGTLIAMTGTETQYSLSQAVFTTGVKKYTVGIYTSRGALRGVINTGTYKVTSADPVNHAPTLTLISSDKTATANTKYTVTLNAKDVDANLNAITMNWGDSTSPQALTATDSKDLVFSHTYATSGDFAWSATATDKGSPVLSSKSVSKIIAVSNPVPVEVTEPPVKTTGYTKIANNGLRLPDTAILGTAQTDWACTKDNQSGLIWQVKTSAYSWEYNFYAETNANAKSLCGKNDWRLPTLNELNSLVYCSDGKNENSCTSSSTSPAINTTYFPNSQSNGFWSSSFGTYGTSTVWVVNFSDGSFSYGYTKSGQAFFIRLVSR